MPRGGKRAGAGRKPKDTKAIVLSLQGERLASPPAYPTVAKASSTVHDGHVLATPPADLTAPEQDAWALLAPLALEQQTLVAATVPGFRELCQVFVHQAELWARITHIGRTSGEADRLLKRWEKGAVLLNGKMKDFKLTAFGKPEVAAIKNKPPAANPWAQVSK